MDNCTRCGDVATTTMNCVRYCNPCSIEAAKLLPLAMFDRVIDDAALRRLAEAWPEWLAVGVRNASERMRLVGGPHSDTNADAVTPVSAIGGVPTSAGIDDPTAPDATQ